MLSAVTAVPRTGISLMIAGAASNVGSAVFLAAIAAAMPVITGFALIWFPATITSKLVLERGTTSENAVAVHEFQQIAVCGLGLYFSCVALFDCVYWAARVHLYQQAIKDPPVFLGSNPLIVDDVAGMAATGVQLLVGISLILCSNGVSRVVTRLRGR